MADPIVVEFSAVARYNISIGIDFQIWESEKCNQCSSFVNHDCCLYLIFHGVRLSNKKKFRYNVVYKYHRLC